MSSLLSSSANIQTSRQRKDDTSDLSENGAWKPYLSSIASDGQEFIFGGRALMVVRLEQYYKAAFV